MNGEEHTISLEERQLSVLGEEIEQEIAVPLTAEEQAQQSEDLRQQDINHASMDIADEQYTQAVALGVSSLWSVAFPNWDKLDPDAELMPMANLTRMVIDKHFPDAMEKAGPEVMLGMVCLTAISVRMNSGVPPRGTLPKKGGECE